MALRSLVRAAADSLWKELGEEAVKTAVNTLVEEGIEAGVEIWKKRRLKIQEELLDKQEFEPEQTEPAGTADRKPYPGREEDVAEPEEPAEPDPPGESDGGEGVGEEDEERAADKERFGSVESSSGRHGIEAFDSYTARRSDD